ncbi:N-acetylmuramoyl-L-alanine amidase CwlD [Effusibacillus consociatus]|uniref:N-acetylmuramoyl-L-alanine amidase CwlD n=1 Tax=Effusibacillus consociatus TaxID=1117041 RepID=A0ABV9PV43_9BACL
MLLTNDWRKISFVSGSIAILLFVVNLFMADVPITKLWSWSAPLSGYTIVLDPGHGGPDGGAVGVDGTVEKTVTLPVSKYLRDYLQQAGAYVIMTREDDRDLANPETKGYSRRKAQDLKARLLLVKEHKADLFFSIHLNSNPGGGRGAQVFYDSELEESERLAKAIQGQFQKQLDSKRDVEPQEDLYLLRNSHVPAVLAEVGFLSNSQELALLKQKSYQKKIAYSIYEGILEYIASAGNIR